MNIHKEENKDRLSKLANLPDNCFSSAEALQKQRAVFEKYNVFSPSMIDGIIANLKQFNDQNLRKELEGNQAGVLELVRKHFHC